MTSVAQGVRPAPERFRPSHPWDRFAFPAFVAAIWAGVLIGFGGEIAHRIQSRAAAYPPIVHVHAVVFVSWLILLTVQTTLIRTRRVETHRRLGLAGMGLAVAMIILGPVTALIVDHREFGQPGSDTPFLIFQLTDLAAFAGLALFAFRLRGEGAAHKRLMLMASLYISDAGFARFLAPLIEPRMGDGYFAQFAMSYSATLPLILALGVYDLITRKRLHPAYVAGLAWVLAVQLITPAIYLSDGWQPLARKLIVH